MSLVRLSGKHHVHWMLPDGCALRLAESNAHNSRICVATTDVTDRSGEAVLKNYIRQLDSILQSERPNILGSSTNNIFVLEKLQAFVNQSLVLDRDSMTTLVKQ